MARLSSTQSNPKRLLQADLARSDQAKRQGQLLDRRRRRDPGRDVQAPEH